MTIVVLPIFPLFNQDFHSKFLQVRPHFHHRFVGLVRTLLDSQATLTRYNLYSSRPQSALWIDSIASVADLFPDFSMEGYPLVVASIPYDAYVTNDVSADPPDDTHLFVNHSGLEAIMVQMTSEKLVRCPPRWGASSS